ncbi:MAG TPA: DegT/DnrJ/EryC1/StrS family aminotransferase [Chloroflexota bacterium]|nr:DegT/DnrJ/EryC1/StrS family aminotransferase [Chloroflexota bacterium]
MEPLQYLRLIADPRRHDDPAAVGLLERRLTEIYGEQTTGHWRIALNGRTGLYGILAALEAQPGDEVVLQAFTCVVAVNPILWASLKPVFADVDPADFSMSIRSLESRITARTRAIIVQHTYGIPGPIEPVVAIARERGLTVIEDCAHALGMSGRTGMLGTMGDAAVTSFGIEKVLSSKAGGAVLLNAGRLRPAFDRVLGRLPVVSRTETLRWLLYPPLRIGIRLLPVDAAHRADSALVRLGLLRQAAAPVELVGGMPPGTPARLSGALAEVVLDHLQSLDENLAHRHSVVGAYGEAFAGAAVFQTVAFDGPLICYPVLCPDRAIRDGLRRRLTAGGIPATAWYDPPVFPRGVDLERIGYDSEAVPVAEDLAGRILCLPTGRIMTPSRARDVAHELIAAAADLEGAAQPVS